MKLISGNAGHSSSTKCLLANKARHLLDELCPQTSCVAHYCSGSGEKSKSGTKLSPPGTKITGSASLHTSSDKSTEARFKSSKKSDKVSPSTSSVTPAWMGQLQKRDSINVASSNSLAKINLHTFNGVGQDLRRFLEEVGTDAKEARYWLKHFQRAAEPLRPFAVLEIDNETLHDDDLLDKLCSCVAFLHRHDMKCVLIHGHKLPPDCTIHPNAFQEVLAGLSEDSMKLVSFLEHNGALARPLFAGTSILLADDEISETGLHSSNVDRVNEKPIMWALQGGHVPIIQALGQTNTGQLVAMDITKATAAVAKKMAPLKVLFVNHTGGINDEKGEIVPNVNLPFDLETLSELPWCTKATASKIEFISDLLKDLPYQSSVVVTSASSLLTELFTHHGSGTFFKIMEPVHKLCDLDDIDLPQLTSLIEQTFQRKLSADYFEKIKPFLHSVYLIEGYGGAAIVLQHGENSIPYLDKFVVSSAKQGDNAGQMLWESMKRDLSRLYWRSRNSNYINPWYFQRSEGSWTDGQWTVFWYGDVTHKQSSQLIDQALNTPISFVPP